jgi:uncharacterized OsmC-like protein
MKKPERSYRSVVGERQAPLRALYQERPEEATIVKLARTGPAAGGDPFHGAVTPVNMAHPDSPYGVTWNYGLDQAVGGLHDAPNPAEMLCGTLAACTDSTIRMIADLLGVELAELSVEVQGDVDVRGTLNVDKSTPVGFQRMQMSVRLRGAPGTPAAALKRLAAAGERFCIILDTLRRGVPVEITVDTGQVEKEEPGERVESLAGQS